MYPTEVIIDRSALRQNFRAIASLVSPSQLVPVIKSDGYGHGIVEVAQAFADAGARQFAVFRLEEALTLRQAGITQDLWIMMGLLPEEAEVANDAGFRIACPDLANARMLSQIATKGKRHFDIHLKVDTGMGRLGVLPESVADATREIAALPGLRLHGIFSHLANADSPEHPVTRRQLDCFRALLPSLPATCRENHLCASRAILHRYLPELPYVRPGICVYGAPEFPGLRLDLRPAMSLRSRVISCKTLPAGANVSYNCICTLKRPSLVGVLPVGYADGYLRELSNCGEALVRGRRVPILGTVCMGMVMVDLSDLPDAQVGDEAVLLGKQGDQEITVWEISEKARSIAHVVYCGIGSAAAAAGQRHYQN
ncbi:MAG: alanine racemase [Lentisphaeria bacterium]|jgi:alanine racemase